MSRVRHLCAPGRWSRFGGTAAPSAAVRARPTGLPAAGRTALPGPDRRV